MFRCTEWGWLPDLAHWPACYVMLMCNHAGLQCAADDESLIKYSPRVSPAAIQGWTSSGQLPMFCNDTATPLDASGKRLAGRNMKVLR